MRRSCTFQSSDVVFGGCLEILGAISLGAIEIYPADGGCCATADIANVNARNEARLWRMVMSDAKMVARIAGAIQAVLAKARRALAGGSFGEQRFGGDAESVFGEFEAIVLR
jgi:hypothetical protein